MPDLLPAYLNQKERGMGLVDVLIALVIILLASLAIFAGITYFAQANTASAINLTSVQAAMSAWTSTPTTTVSPTASTQSYNISVNVNYVAATSGTQSESIPVALAESGSNYGWSKVATQ